MSLNIITYLMNLVLHYAQEVIGATFQDRRSLPCLALVEFIAEHGCERAGD
jgi:hypothetical protein